MKLETHGGPMQGPTAGIIRVLVLIHVAEIGIDLRGGRKEKSLNDVSLCYLIKPLVTPAGNSHGVTSWNRSGLVKNKK